MDSVPRFYMYDIARGAFLRPSSFKQILRHAAACGFTHFVPYLENMIHLPSMEKAARKCAYTADDWRNFQDTATEAGIELVPHFNVIGHSNQICLAYPELTGETSRFSDHNRRQSEIFSNQADPALFSEIDPTISTSREWMLRCLEEYCSFSQSKYFLIGGDEWNVPRHLLAAKGFDPGLAWGEFMNIAIAFLHAKNRIPIVWHDMLVHYPQVLNILSRNATIAFWFYDNDAGYPFLKMLKDSGFKTIMATGLCNGAFSLRREKAFHKALVESKKYHTDGFMVTTWLDGRFERQKANLTLCGRLLAGKKISPIFPETVSTFIFLNKLQNIASKNLRDHWKKRLMVQLSDPSWGEFPEYRAILRDSVENHYSALKKRYARHHYPEGPLYQTFQAVKKTHAPSENKNKLLADRMIPDRFGIEFSVDTLTGNTIRFYNSDETFVIYPDFGARLQDWRTNTFSLIGHDLPVFLKNHPNPLPGAFKSCTSPGFLPMWDIGTHLNPAITWQYPWNFWLDTGDPNCPGVVIHRKFPHVELTYRISIERGRPGFKYHLTAVNLLPGAFGAFGWNFCISGINALKTVFSQESKSTFQSISVFDTPNDMIQLEPCSCLTLKNELWALNIDIPKEKCAGFWIDWGNDWMTPDLHGKYIQLDKGDIYQTEWIFSLRALRTE